MPKSLLHSEDWAQTKEDWLELLQELDYRYRLGHIHLDIYKMTSERYIKNIEELENAETISDSLRNERD